YHHVEMVPFKEFVLESIRQPNGIYLGKRDPTRRIYRKSYLEVPGVGNSLDLLVFLGDDGKHVATAYFAAFSLENVRKVGLAFNYVQNITTSIVVVWISNKFQFLK